MEINLNKKQALESVIQAYKQACVAMEIAAKSREELKEQLLEIVEHKEGNYGEITISKINPEPSFDWKSLLEEYQFTAMQLKKFYKEKESYLRILVKRSIAL